MPIDYSRIPTNDLEALQSGDLSKVSTRTLEYISLYNKAPARKEEEKSSVGQTVSNIARPVLEYGGMIGGGLLGSGAAPVAGTVAGAGLGYGAGNLAANYLDEKLGIRKPPDVLDRIAQTGRGVTEGAMMETGAGIAGNLLQRGGRAIANSGLPEWLYSKAMKTPMSEAWKRTIPTKEWTKREMALNTGMQDGILPNALGKEKVVNRIADIDTKVKSIVSELTKQGEKTATINSLTEPIDALKPQANMARDGLNNINSLDALKQELVRKGGVQQKLNPGELQELKQQFYQDINWDASRPILNEKNRFTEKATKAVAEKAMTLLEGMAPELKYLNKKESAYITLQKAIEHTITRYENTNAVGIGAKIMSVRNVGMAALDVLTGTPTFKAALALALKKAGTNAHTFGRAAMIYGAKDDQ